LKLLLEKVQSRFPAALLPCTPTKERNPMSATTADVARPSLSLLGTEPLRAALEYARHRLSPQRPAPRGDGHPIVIFPGLGSDGASPRTRAGCCRPSASAPR
jgi:hypothetical protein